MSVTENWGHAPLLEMALSFSAFEKNPFNKHDAKAMSEALGVVRTAMVQPFGTAAAKRDGKAVTNAEFDRAVATVLCCAMTLWLSGGLDESRWPE